MAALVVDSPEGLIRTSGIAPASGDYTICGWFYVPSIPTPGTYRTFFYIGDDPASYVEGSWVGLDFNGFGNIYFNSTAVYNPGTNWFRGAGWYHAAYTRTGTTHRLYIQAILSVSAVQDQSAQTYTHVLVHTDTYPADWYTTRGAYVREWDVALSAAEIALEMASTTPVQVADLWSDAPLATDLLDDSGNGYHWSQSGGTITFGPQPSLVPPPILVRQATNAALTTDPDTVAYTVNVLAGSSLALIVAFGDLTTVTGVTDSVGNTWVLGVAANVTSYRLESWYVPVALAGATTVTLNLSGVPGGVGARVWVIEVQNLLGFTFGISNTLDTVGAVDPIPLATLSPTQAGVVLTAVHYDGTETFQNWEELNSFMVDAGGGTSSRGGFRTVTGAIALTPAINNSSAASGESMTVAYYGTPVGVPATFYPQTRATVPIIEGPGAGAWAFHGTGPQPDTLAMFTYRTDRQKGLGGAVSQPDQNQTCNQQGNYDVPTFCRWITDPLDVQQTIDGTFDLCQLVRGRWQDSILGYTNDSLVRYKVHVYISVGQTIQVRHTLLSNYVDSVNFPGTSGAVWRQLVAAQTLTSGVGEVGDSIIIETGFRIVSSPTPAPAYPPDDWTQIDWTGIATVGSFPDAVNGDTSTSRAPWFKFSIPISTQIQSNTPPANDACADAIVVAAFPYESALIDTTQSQDTNRRVWWKFTAPSTGTMILTTFGGNYATTLEIFTGNCAGLVAASYGVLEDSGVGRASTVAILNATLGTEYFVRVGSDSTSTTARDSGGMLRLTIGYRELPQEDDLYVVSRHVNAYRDTGTLVNVSAGLTSWLPNGVAIDYTHRSMVNAGGSPGGNPHTGDRLYVGLFGLLSIVEILDLPSLSYTSSGGTDIDVIQDPWIGISVPLPNDARCGQATLYLTRAGLLVTCWFGNGFLYVAGQGTSRPAFLNTISSASDISAIKSIDAQNADNQPGAPFSYVPDVPSLESTTPWGGWLNEVNGNLYYVSGSPYDCPLVPSQEIRVYNVFTHVQGPIFATLIPQSVFHPAVRGLCGIMGEGDVFLGLLACNGNTIQRLDFTGAVTGTYTPSTPDENPHLGLMDVEILSDGIHALTIDYISRRVWKFNLLTMTEVSTYPTYMLGPFVQMVVYLPNGITPTPPFIPCPGILGDPREDGVIYTPTIFDPCLGPGLRGDPRTGA